MFYLYILLLCPQEPVPFIFDFLTFYYINKNVYLCIVKLKTNTTMQEMTIKVADWKRVGLLGVFKAISAAMLQAIIASKEEDLDKIHWLKFDHSETGVELEITWK